MFTLLKNARIFAPQKLGVQDILLVEHKIAAIGQLSDSITLPGLKVENLQGAIVTPGLIDQHVHLIGGGGEAGFTSRTPEIKISTIVKHGVTSVVGLLGTDCDTRHPASLNAKARALTEEGISAWMLTGGYNIPSPTITGSLRNDIIYAESCIGAKLAISDHRSPHISYDEFIRLASDCRIAGMLSQKAGTLTLHTGDAPQYLDLLFRAVTESAIPAQQFIPTHVNRNNALYDEALRWARQGGRIDITTGFEEGENVVTTLDAVVKARESGISEQLITISSDAQGSMPIFNQNGELSGIGIAEQNGLIRAVHEQVNLGYSLSHALEPVTTSVANCLKLVNKGRIQVGYDADFIVLSDELKLQQTWAKGRCLYKNGQSCTQTMFD